MKIQKKSLLILSTSLFTNRILSDTLLSCLSQEVNVIIWAVEKPYFAINSICDKFPVVANNRERINFLRRINEWAWIKRKDLVSIKSMHKFNQLHNNSSFGRLQIFLGNIIFLFRLNVMVDKILIYFIKKQKRSQDALNRLSILKPDVILVTNPFWMHETAVAVEAKSLGIPIYSLIPSWDNLTTKSRLTFNSDAYFVWSNIRMKELHNIYPITKSKPVFVYGTPQYDVFRNYQYFISREEFCKHYGLNPNLKILLYATGSPNFIKTEYDAASIFQQEFQRDSQLNCYQLLIRPHPNKDNNELQHLHQPDKNCFVQYTPQAGLQTEQRNLDKEGLILWINTFRHADAIINLSSTVTLDAIACGKPVINLNFDISGNSIFDSYIKEINSTWTHLLDIWKCTGIPQVNSITELKVAIIQAIVDPDKGKYERDQLFLKLCGNPKDLHGNNLAETLINMIYNFRKFTV